MTENKNKSEWDKAKETLEGVRPYEDGYERDSVHRLIESGDKLQEKIKNIQKVMKESYDGGFEELWNGLVEVLDRKR